jgi:hypothetical protein
MLHPRCRHVRVERCTWCWLPSVSRHTRTPIQIVGDVFALDVRHAVPQLLAIPAVRPEHVVLATGTDPTADHRLKIAPDGQREETLITHLKVWEDGGPEAAMAPTDTDGKKVRYLLLAGECLSSDYTCNGGLTSNGVLSGQDRSSLPP